MALFVKGQKILLTSIAKLTDDLAVKNVTLCRLKNENTMMFEKLQWRKEKFSKLNIQVRKYHEEKQLQDNLVQFEEKEQDNFNNQQQILLRILNESQYDKYDLRFLKLVSSYLDKVNCPFTRLTRFSSKRKGKDQDYINPYLVINVRPEIGGFVHLQIISLRIDEKTNFIQIKNMAFLYWMLDQSQVGEEEIIILSRFELTDDTFSLLPLQENVQNFYQDQGKYNLDQITLILRYKKTQAKQIDTLQSESIKIHESKLNARKLDSLFVTSSSMIIIDPYKQFFISLPGLRQFIDEGLIHKEEELRVHAEIQQKKVSVEDNMINGESFQNLYEVDDSHCCVLSCILVMLVQCFMNNQYNSMLESSLVFKNVTAFNLLFNLVQKVPGSYNSIQTQDQFWDYMKTYIGKGLLDSEYSPNFYRENYEIIGNIRLRQLKMPSQNCRSYVNEYQKTSCFYTQYDQNNQYTQNKSNRSSQMDTWRFFQTAQQLNEVYNPKGIITSYSGDGYVIDFQRDLKYEEFLQQIVVLQQDEFLDHYTSAVFVQYTSYSPTNNIWTYCVLIFERNIKNQLIPYYPTILIFVPNIYEGSIGTRNIIIDIVRTVLATILTIFTIYNLNKKNKNVTLMRWNFNYLFVELGALNLTVAILSIASFLTTLKQTSSQLKTQELINQNDYVDLYKEAQYYNLTLIIRGVSILFLCIRISVVLKSNDNLNLIFLALNKALIQIVAFTFSLMPYFIGFGLAFQQLWGTFLFDFSTFNNSLGSLFKLAFGQIPSEILQKNPNSYNLVFITIFYFFVIFFVQSIFQSFLIESYRTVIMTKGYPQPTKQTFSFKTITRWAFSWFYCWIDIPFEEINALKKKRLDREQTELLLPDDKNMTRLQSPLQSPRFSPFEKSLYSPRQTPRQSPRQTPRQTPRQSHSYKVQQLHQQSPKSPL